MRLHVDREPSVDPAEVGLSGATTSGDLLGVLAHRAAMDAMPELPDRVLTGLEGLKAGDGGCSSL